MPSKIVGSGTSRCTRLMSRGPANYYSLCSFWTLTCYCNVSRCKVQKNSINIWKRIMNCQIVTTGPLWLSFYFWKRKLYSFALISSLKMVRESREQSRSYVWRSRFVWHVKHERGYQWQSSFVCFGLLFCHIKTGLKFEYSRKIMEEKQISCYRSRLGKTGTDCQKGRPFHGFFNFWCRELSENPSTPVKRACSN